MAKSDQTKAPKSTPKASGEKPKKNAGEKPKKAASTEATEVKKLSAEIKNLIRDYAKLRKELDTLKRDFENGGRKMKKEKDPNAPKKSKNGYMFFCGENRERIKKDNKDIDGKEIVKKLSEEWNKMNDKQKAKYQKMADADRVRYEKEKTAYDQQKAAEN